jgi:hypothetical protein
MIGTSYNKIIKNDLPTRAEFEKLIKKPLID